MTVSVDISQTSFTGVTIAGTFNGWNNGSNPMADDDGDAASEAFAGKGSSIFALGGVGHGELFVGTYEGNKFKPMYR